MRPKDFLGYFGREAPELFSCRSMRRLSSSASESYEDRASQPHVTFGGSEGHCLSAICAFIRYLSAPQSLPLGASEKPLPNMKPKMCTDIFTCTLKRERNFIARGESYGLHTWLQVSSFISDQLEYLWSYVPGSSACRQKSRHSWWHLVVIWSTAATLKAWLYDGQ